MFDVLKANNIEITVFWDMRRYVISMSQSFSILKKEAAGCSATFCTCTSNYMSSNCGTHDPHIQCLLLKPQQMICRGTTALCLLLYFFNGWTALMGLSLPTVKISKSHSDTQHSVGLFWTKDRPVAETFTGKHTTLTRQKSMPRTRFEPAFPASERKPTHALDRATTGMGLLPSAG